MDIFIVKYYFTWSTNYYFLLSPPLKWLRNERLSKATNYVSSLEKANEVRKNTQCALKPGFLLVPLAATVRRPLRSPAALWFSYVACRSYARSFLLAGGRVCRSHAHEVGRTTPEMAPITIRKKLQLLLLLRRRQLQMMQSSQRHHRFWVHLIFTARKAYGQFHTLMEELRDHDREYFLWYLLWSPSSLLIPYHLAIWVLPYDMLSLPWNWD